MNFVLQLLIDHSLWVLMLAVCGVWVHFAVIGFIPKFLTSKYIQSVYGVLEENGVKERINAICHYGPVGSYSRDVILPSPDFCYSSAHFILEDAKSVQILPLPRRFHFQNLAFYDRSARCVVSKSYIDTDCGVVVVGPFVVHSDEEILAALPKSDRKYEIIRLPLTETLFLHRFFMPYRSKFPEYKTAQRNMVVKTLELPPRANTAASVTVTAPVVSTDWLSISFAASVLAVILQILWSKYNNSDNNLIDTNNYRGFGGYSATAIAGFTASIIASILIGAVSAVGIIAKLRSGRGKKKDKSVAVEIHRGCWSFTFLTINELGFNPYLTLYWFLFGAFGLPNDAVCYGSTHKDSSENELNAEKNYLIECETSDFHCEWWSITAYAYDQFLVPNDDHIYSKNNINIFVPVEEELSKLSPRHPDNKAHHPSARGQYPGFRIYCSANKPEEDSPYASLPWLPLTPPSVIHQPETKTTGFAYLKKLFTSLLFIHQKDKRDVQLLIRAYSPDPAFWAADKTLLLPTIRAV